MTGKVRRLRFVHSPWEDKVFWRVVCPDGHVRVAHDDCEDQAEAQMIADKRAAAPVACGDLAVVSRVRMGARGLKKKLAIVGRCPGGFHRVELRPPDTATEAH